MPELDYSMWFEATMVQDPNDPDVFRGSPNEGIILVETRYVQNPRAQGKNRGESWSATIELVIQNGGEVPEASLRAGGFDSNRGDARAEALAKLKELFEPIFHNIRLLGLLKTNDS